MHKAIEEIIDRLISAVKTAKPYYSLKDLLNAGFPNFFVERIRLEINEKIRSDLSKPESEWTDSDADLIREAWEDFIQSSFSNSRIPDTELYDLVGKVITDIVKVFLEPRTYMADYIYKGKEELTFEELLDRTAKLTIYKHFARAIPLYMNKRDLHTLEKAKCKALIQNLDSKLVASYSAEDWAQILNPIFTLFGGKVDARIIQLFFEDKDLFLTAKAFNELDEEISRERFIEVLSYPDLLNVEMQHEFREKYRQELIHQKNRFDTPDPEETIEVEMDEKERKLIDNFFEGYEDQTLADMELDDSGSFNDIFREEEEELYSDRDAVDEEKEEDEDSEEKPKTGGRFHEKIVNVLDEAASAYKNLNEEIPEEEKEAEKEEKEIAADTSEKKESEEEQNFSEPSDELEVDPEEGEEDGPMWQQFLRPDQMDLLMANREDEGAEHEEPESGELIAGGNQGEEENSLNNLYSAQSDEEDEGITVGDDDYIEDPLGGFGNSPEEEVIIPEKETVSELKDYLGKRKNKKFTRKLFGGSAGQYQSVLREINKLNTWKDASAYLNQEVFIKNNIDMFSEDAVEFTDLLQAYFTDKT